MEKYMENLNQIQKKNLPVNSQSEDKSLDHDEKEIEISEQKSINVEFSFGSKTNIIYYILKRHEIEKLHINDINSTNPFEAFSNKKSNEFHLNLKTKVFLI